MQGAASRRFASLAFAIGTFLSSLGAASAASDPRACATNPYLPYDRPLGLTMETLDGPRFDLTQERGKPVVLTMFATWCEACQEELPELVAAQKHYAGLGLHVVLIDVREPDNTVRRYRDRNAITLPIAMDRDGTITRAIQLGGGHGTVYYPTMLLIGRDGRIACYTQTGLDASTLDAQIAHVLAAPAPSP